MEDYKYFTFIKNFKDWKIIKTKDHELNYKIVVESNKIILFFQESDGKKDWKDNLNFFPIYTKVYKNQESKIRCHRGFIKEYKSGNDEIMEKLINTIADTNIYNITIAGWSNGAAMATLAAEDFYYRTSIKPEVITFGSPKVCYDRESAKFIKNCCTDFREYCHQSDIVTKLPPFGEHVAEIKIGKYSLARVLNPWKFHTNYDLFLRGQI